MSAAAMRSASRFALMILAWAFACLGEFVVGEVEAQHGELVRHLGSGVHCEEAAGEHVEDGVETAAAASSNMAAVAAG